MSTRVLVWAVGACAAALLALLVAVRTQPFHPPSCYDATFNITSTVPWRYWATDDTVESIERARKVAVLRVRCVFVFVCVW